MKLYFVVSVWVLSGRPPRPSRRAFRLGIGGGGRVTYSETLRSADR